MRVWRNWLAAADLKSAAFGHEGSNPSTCTDAKTKVQMCNLWFGTTKIYITG